MTPEQRIKLAEFCGWQKYRPRHWSGQYPGVQWIAPDKSKCASLPDPFTDANDCEALIRRLAKDGWCTTTHQRCGGMGDQVAMWQMGFWGSADQRMNRVWEGNDYKQGVCELALRVIDDDIRRD